MNYNQAVSWILSLERFGIKLGLERINKLLDKLGNPQNELKAIHVAGTNGKGSVCAMLESVLMEAGYKVGKYTSPHLIKFNERITVNSEEIENNELAKLIQKIKPLHTNETFFEVTTAMAFLYFKEKNVDFAVIEVGLGGRLDATSVISRPLVSVITNVDLEHTEHLGRTVEEIAKEKAAIIKNKGIVVTGAEGEALAAIEKFSKEKKAKLLNARPTDAKLSLQGDFQKINAGIAIKTIKALKNHNVFIPKNVILEGLLKAEWPGRFQIEGNLIYDCAHNPSGIAVLVNELVKLKQKTNYKNLILVIGIMKDKDIKTMAKEIKDIADKAIITKPKLERSAEPKEIARFFDDYEIIENVKQAVKYAKSVAKKDDLVVVTGSIFLVGEALS